MPTVTAKPIALPSQGNILYPLPPDYSQLTAEGKAAARVNACRLRRTPEESVASWLYFRNQYLRWDGAFWYGEKFIESPPFHSDLIYSCAAYRRVAITAPRYFAKSTVLEEKILLDTIALDGNRTILLKSTDAFVEYAFEKLMTQIDENSRIIDDFGKLHLGRGKGIWNHHALKLGNRSWVLGLSVEGKIRNVRADLAIIDDPEDDKDFLLKGTRGTAVSSARARLMAKFETLLFRKIMRAVSIGGTLLWAGTLLDRRAWLYHIICGDDTRFDSWKKIYWKGRDERGSSTWSAKWSDDQLKKDIAEMDASSAASEIDNDPIPDAALVFNLTKDHHGYHYPSGTSHPPIKPFECTDVIAYNECGKNDAGEIESVARVVPFNQLISKMQRCVTIDYAAPGVKHDFACIAVQGLDSRNDQWILELWLGQARSAALIRLAWDLAVKWRVRVLGAEAVALQEEFGSQVKDLGAQVYEQLGWCPQMVPITYPFGVSKEERIAGLEHRAVRGKIKFPWNFERVYPYDQLFLQFRDFTPDGRGLVHDDAIDAVCMLQRLFRSSNMRREGDPPARTPIQQLQAGQLLTPEGHPILAAVGDLGNLPPDLLSARIYGNLEMPSDDPCRIDWGAPSAKSW